MIHWQDLTQEHLAFTVSATLLIALGAAYLWSTFTRSPLRKAAEKARHESDPHKHRPHGEWNAIHFNYPEIPACTIPLPQLKAVPYRPFRWGQYHITMGIRSMPWPDWIELDSQFETYQRIKAHRIATRAPEVVRVLPETPGLVGGGKDAAEELVQELAEYLSRRYPDVFSIERHTASSARHGWYGEPPVKNVTIKPLGVTYDLEKDEAIKVIAMLIQDDIAIMIEGTDGQYYFQAGAICLAGSWRLRDKLGLSLSNIHTTGNVPQFQQKLQVGMERFFRRMPVDKPVIRNNYFIQIVQPASVSSGWLDPEELAWSSTAHGPEDSFLRRHRRGRDRQSNSLENEDEEDEEEEEEEEEEETKEDTSTNDSDANIPQAQARIVPTPATMRLRTERQTLRRLPKTGAIVFTIRSYMFPLEELGKERGVPARMASAVRGWGPDVQIYKAQASYRDVLLDYLDECHRKQVESGEVGEDEKVETTYPY